MSIILLIQTRHEGPLLSDHKDGDIFDIRPGGTTLGLQETKRWLAVDLADVEYSEDLRAELVRSEIVVQADGTTRVTKSRVYRVPAWRTKLTPEEVTAAEDRDTDVPLITGRFTYHTDIVGNA